MRTLMMLMILGCALRTPAVAKDDEDLKLKVKVALALSAKASGCGICRTDEEACRSEALHDRKPLVLFVGGCNEQGEAVLLAGGIPCRVEKYDRDGKDVGKRIVVLSPGDNEFRIDASLPFDAKADEIRSAIGHASPTPPKTMPTALDWDIKADLPAQQPAAKQYTTICVNGTCYRVEVK